MSHCGRNEIRMADNGATIPGRIVVLQQSPGACNRALASPKPVPPKSEDLLKRKEILTTGMTESEEIAEAQAGDVGCFEALYTRHKRRVFSLCLRMTGNHAQAEDFTQEAFLQVYRKIALFRSEEHTSELQSH